MDLTNLKLSVLVFFTAYFFVNGSDSYIILPTAWYYIQSLGYSKTFYGAVLAAPSLGLLLFSPIVGKLANKTRRVKLIILISLAIKVIAYLVYAIPVSGYCPLAGCFFSGAANSAYGVMYGEMVRYTLNVNRSKLFILIDSVFAVGATCGPVFGSIVTFEANILGWDIDDGNSPGLVLAAIWCVMLCMIIFLPSDFGTEEMHLTHENEVEMLGDNAKLDNGLLESLNLSTFCLYYLNFTNSLLQSAFAALAPLLAMELFHWKLLHDKLLFGTGMMFVFVIYLVSYIATGYYNERSLVAFTVILQLPSLLILICYAVLWTDVPYFIGYLLIVYIGFGMCQACFAIIGSLLSKTTPKQHASIVQSLLILGSYMSYIAGRGVAGMMFAQTWLLGFSLGLAAVWLFGIAWFVLVFSRFAPDQLNQTSSRNGY